MWFAIVICLKEEYNEVLMFSCLLALRGLMLYHPRGMCIHVGGDCTKNPALTVGIYLAETCHVIMWHLFTVAYSIGDVSGVRLKYVWNNVISSIGAMLNVQQVCNSFIIQRQWCFKVHITMSDLQGNTYKGLIVMI